MARSTYAGKPTIAVYKENIQQLESELNARLTEVDTEQLPELFRRELNELTQIRPKSRSVKADYLRYQRELDYLLQWDINTAEGRRQLEARERKAYETFQKRFGDIDYQDWRKLVETFGSVGASVMEQFYRGGQGGNGDLIRVYKDAKEQGKSKDIGKAMLQVMRDSKKEDFKYQKTPTGLLDALRDKMGIKS